MNLSSRVPQALALAIALAAHGALAVALVATETPRIEGSDGAAEMRLGNAFADMAMGTLEADPAETVAPAAPPDRAQAAPPDFGQADSAESAAPATRSEPPPPAKPEHAPAETPRALSPDRAVAVLPDAAAPARTPPPPASETLRAADAATAAPADRKDPERLAATEAEPGVVARSVRPSPRSAGFEAAHTPPPRPERTEPRRIAQPPAAPRGNADRNARAGEATGSAEATARKSGSAGAADAAGNAAASNYPGLVMRKLSRAGKPQVSARGAAVVAFTISASGGLANVSLARRSGNAGLDRAAIQIVRSAAPFPPPPAGAGRSFSVQIQGR